MQQSQLVKEHCDLIQYTVGISYLDHDATAMIFSIFRAELVIITSQPT